MNWYLENLYNIIVKPVFFYHNMPKGSWSEEPLSFMLVTGWILSFCLTFVVFVNSYLPTGFTLIEGIYGKKLLIALPVLSVMGVAFFLMTLFIVAGLFIMGIMGMLFGCAVALNFLLILLGGKGNIYETGKAVLYSSAVIVAGCFNLLMMIAVRYKLLSLGGWIFLERVVFYLASAYLFWLFSIIGEKTHKLPRWKAMLAATIPFVLLVLFNFVFSAKVLPKIAGILS